MYYYISYVYAVPQWEKYKLGICNLLQKRNEDLNLLITQATRIPLSENLSYKKSLFRIICTIVPTIFFVGTEKSNKSQQSQIGSSFTETQAIKYLVVKTQVHLIYEKSGVNMIYLKLTK